MLFKLSNLNSNLALTLGYLKPALNNSAQNKNLELTANNSKRNKQTNIPAMKAVVRNILCTVIWVIGDRLKWV